MTPVAPFFSPSTRVALGLAADFDPTSTLRPDERFALSAIVAVAGLVQADDRVDPAEHRFVEKVLLPALGGGDRSDTTLPMLEEAAGASREHWVEHLRLFATGLDEGPRRIVLALGAAVVASDGKVAHVEHLALRAAATALGLSASAAQVAASAAVGVGPNGDWLAWPKGLDPVALQLSPLLQRSLLRAFRERGGERPQPRAEPSDATTWHGDLGRMNGALERLQAIARQGLAAVDGVVRSPLTDLLPALQGAAAKPLEVVVVGEFSTGKSSLINALCGAEVLPVAAVPCSAATCSVRRASRRRYLQIDSGGERELTKAEFDGFAQLSDEESTMFDGAVPVARPELRVELPNVAVPPGVEVVDLPGLQEHAARTAQVDLRLPTADAVLIVLNGARPLSRSEREMVDAVLEKRSLAGRTAESVFVVLGFADVLRTSTDVDQVLQRARAFFAGRVPDDRVWLVSALRALEGEPTWGKRFAEMTGALGAFLGTGPGAGRMHRFHLGTAEALEQTMRALTDRSVTIELGNKKVEARLEAGRQALTALEQARTHMLADIARTRGRAAARAEDAVHSALHRAATALPVEAEGWRSENNVVFSRKALVADLVGQATSSVERNLATFQMETLAPLIEEEVAGLRKVLDGHAAELEKALAVARGIELGQPTHADKPQDGALARIFRGAGGFLAGGPLGVLVADALGWKGVAVNFGLTFSLGFILAILGVALNPLVLAAAVAALAVGQLWLGKDGAKVKMAKETAKHVAEAVRAAAPQASKEAGGKVGEVFDEMGRAIDTEFDAMVALKRHDLELLSATTEADAEATLRMLSAVRDARSKLEFLVRDLGTAPVGGN